MPHYRNNYLCFYLVGILFLTCFTCVPNETDGTLIMANLTAGAPTARPMSTTPSKPNPSVKSVSPLADIMNIFSETSQGIYSVSHRLSSSTVDPAPPMEGGGNPTEKVAGLVNSLVHQNLTTLSREKVVNRGLGLVPEKTNLTSSKTALPIIQDNVHEPSVSHEKDETLPMPRTSDLCPQGTLNNLEEDSKSSKIHARKGAENLKINARKGAIPDDGVKHNLDVSSSTVLPKQIIIMSNRPTSLMHISNSSMITINRTEHNDDVPHNSIGLVNSSISNSDMKSTYNSSQLLPNVSENHVIPVIVGDALKNVTNTKLDPNGDILASYPPLKKKAKPSKTTDTNSFTDSVVLKEHTPSQHEYVVPIVVAILTVPMLVVLALFLYKKGSEFWERRHYRRMDFLIDGMYND